MTKSQVMNLPSSLPLTTYLSPAPRQERIRYSLLVCPLKVCSRPPFALSKSRMVESNVDTRIQLLSSDCQTHVIGSRIRKAKRKRTSNYICRQLSCSQIVCAKFPINRAGDYLVVFDLYSSDTVFCVFEDLDWHAVLRSKLEGSTRTILAIPKTYRSIIASTRKNTGICIEAYCVDTMRMAEESS